MTEEAAQVHSCLPEVPGCVPGWGDCLLFWAVALGLWMFAEQDMELVGAGGVTSPARGHGLTPTCALSGAPHGTGASSLLSTLF